METILQLDHSLFQWINQDLSNTLFDSLMPVIRNKKTWIPFYILGATLLIWKQKKKGLLIILTVIVAVVLSDAVSSHLFKPYFHRIRPCNLPEFTNQMNLVLAKCSGAYSFPSSHAANHFAIAITLSLFFIPRNKTLSFILILWASLICFAQIYVGVHFPSDVIGGMLIGVLLASLVWFTQYLLTKKYRA